jgi:broad specificity phosphatase PhoE
MPDFSPETPASEWLLSDAGHAEARLLADVLPGGSRLVASDEPKAWQTLEPAGHVTRDLRFNEVWRTEPWDGNWRQLRRAYVEGADHPGWEPRSRVAARFGTALSEHLDAAGGRPLVVATHGMAMTIWLTARIALPDPGAFWAGLRFPDAHRVNLQAGTIARLR